MIPQSRISHQIRKIKANQQKISQQKQIAESELKNKDVKAKKLSFTACTPAEAKTRWDHWLSNQKMTPFDFQLQSWRAFAENKSYLIAVPTGSGKTLAAMGGPLMKMMSTNRPLQNKTQIIYFTPLKSLARDVALAIEKPIADLKLPFQVGLRTGDSTALSRRELKNQAPEILVTTPESFAIMLTTKDCQTQFSDVYCVIIDEGHELLGTKRGSLLELSIATLKQYSATVQITAMSATLGNLNEAAPALTGDSKALVIVSADSSKPIEIDVLTPTNMSAAPWFGYAGLNLAEDLLRFINPNETQIIFTNTRGSAEAWYRDIIERRPEWKEETALHHGSLSKEERTRVEIGAKSGLLKIIVATSSLELGVDFPRATRIFQIGSVKSLARAVQRAGRGYHRPHEGSHLIICPSTLFEILEASALRAATQAGVFENKNILKKPLDVFVQFLLNRAFNDGFTVDEIKETLAATYSFKSISESELNWALNFLTLGGPSLSGYPQFLKLQLTNNRFHFSDPKLARLHRMNIGTIVSDDGLNVRFAGGKSLGTIGETFVSRLKKGDVFQFSGRELEYVALQYTTLIVKLAKERPEIATVWNGQILPISSVISEHLKLCVHQLAKAQTEEDLTAQELRQFWPVAQKQKRISSIPHADETLVELWKSREGHHLFLYTWAGRLVNEGLGHLMAYRIAQLSPNTISVAASEHGFELLAAENFPDKDSLQKLFSNTNDLEKDIEQSLNFPELAKRSFREVARVSGLIQSNSSGQKKNQRLLQMSSGLLYDVFEKYEPDHPLVQQAKIEVRSQQLNLDRLTVKLMQMKENKFIFNTLEKLSPFAFPLFIERARTRISTEKLEHRIARFQRQITEDT